MSTSNREYGAFYPTTNSRTNGVFGNSSGGGRNKTVFSLVDAGASPASVAGSGKSKLRNAGRDSFKGLGSTSGLMGAKPSAPSESPFPLHTPSRTTKPTHSGYAASGSSGYRGVPGGSNGSGRGGTRLHSPKTATNPTPLTLQNPPRVGSHQQQHQQQNSHSNYHPSPPSPKVGSTTVGSPKINGTNHSGRFSSANSWSQNSPKASSSFTPAAPSSVQSASQSHHRPPSSSKPGGGPMMPLSHSQRNMTLHPSHHRPGSSSGGGMGAAHSLPKMGFPDDDAASVAYGFQSVGGVSPGFFKENQDECLVIKKPFSSGGDVGGGGSSKKDFFAAVMDGHGLAGKHVSHFVKDKLMQDDFQRRLASDSPDDALTWAYNRAATELKRSGVDHRESGSTAVSLLRKGNSLVCANVGDSRCVMGRMQGGDLKAVSLSRDHKPQRKDEMERIQRMRGHVEPSRAFGGRFVGPARVWAVKQQVGGLAVSRAIGDTNLNSVGVIPQPEIMKETVTENDKFVILASDGVWEHLSSQDAVNIAKQHYHDPKKASEALVSKAREAWSKERCGYRDDITAVVVKLE